MPNFSTKTIITAAGAILLLIAGAVTMFLMPSGEDFQPQSKIVASSLNSSPQNQADSSNTSLASQNSQAQSDNIVSNPQLLSSSETNQDTSPVKIWYVYVTGAVKSPGVYKLSEDSRIFQAVDAAGGFTSKADETSLNLAEPLADGVHVHVATKGERNNNQQNNLVRIPGVAQNNSIIIAPSGNGNLVDINRASESELQRLNGIGPALAKQIIEYRQSHGAFTRPEDLLKVSGIGQAKLKNIRSQIQVGNGINYSQNSSIVSPRSQSTGNLIDINHASESELQRLNGIGPSLAKRIIQYRQSHGNFTRPEDLLKVSGIGQAKLKNIRSQIQIR